MGLTCSGSLVYLRKALPLGTVIHREGTHAAKWLVIPCPDHLGSYVFLTIAMDHVECHELATVSADIHVEMP